MRIPTLALLVAAVSAPFHYATNVTIHPAADTTLFESNPTFNLGGSTTLVAGTTSRGLKSRALLRFDIASAIPPGAQIQSATLTLVVTRAPTTAGTGSTFALHRLLLPWGEGNKSGNTGAEADPNEATWMARFAPNVFWSSPGAAAPLDFSPIISSQTAIDQPGPYAFPSSSNLVADLQLWLSDTNQNFGWILMSQSESNPQTARRFGSREDDANAPSLTIEFSGGGPFRISKTILADSKLSLEWQNGRPPFQMQRRFTLAQPWQNFGQPLNTNSIALPMDTSAAFFRILSSQ